MMAFKTSIRPFKVSLRGMIKKLIFSLHPRSGLEEITYSESNKLLKKYFFSYVSDFCDTD